MPEFFDKHDLNALAEHAARCCGMETDLPSFCRLIHQQFLKRSHCGYAYEYAAWVVLVSWAVERKPISAVAVRAQLAHSASPRWDNSKNHASYAHRRELISATDGGFVPNSATNARFSEELEALLLKIASEKPRLEPIAPRTMRPIRFNRFDY